MQTRLGAGVLCGLILVLVVPVNVVCAQDVSQATSKNRPPESETTPDPAMTTHVYLAGPSVPKPGDHELRSIPTYAQAFELGAIDPNQIIGKGHILRQITLWSGTSGSAEKPGLAQDIKKHGNWLLDQRIVNPSDVVRLHHPDGTRETQSESRPHVIFWAGSANEWRALERASRGGGRGHLGGQWTSLGQWPQEYDELMALAGRASEIGYWPGGETWTESGEDNRVLRRLIADFAAAAREADAEAMVPLLTRVAVGSAVRDAHDMIERGIQIAKIVSISVRRDRGILVSDFFAYERSKPHRMRCVLYQVRKKDNMWRIEDIDLETAEGLVEEVLRFAEQTESD